MVLSGTIPFSERPLGSPATFQDQGNTAVQVLLVDYLQADALVGELLGTTNIIGSGGAQRRVAPERHPRYPYLFARQCTYQGIGLATDGIFEMPGGEHKYEKAEITVQYGIPNFEDQDRPETQIYMTESRDHTATFQTIPGRKFKFKVPKNFIGPTPEIDHTIGKLLPELSINIDVQHWAGVDPDDPVYDDTIGKVNKKDVFFLRNYKKETMLFEGASFTRDFTSDGVSAWRAQMRFRYRSQTWQVILNPSGRFQEIEAGGEPPYETADFEKIKPF